MYTQTLSSVRKLGRVHNLRGSLGFKADDIGIPNDRKFGLLKAG